tara:strand:+ start:320 stop:1513 length:1194 start_codon:yes stop_codon:yes gene_type:complete
LNLSRLIALQFIFSNYKNNFTKTASLLSIIGLSFGVSSLLITFFILNGFENVISEKITNFDGHIQIKHFFNKSITDSQFIADSLEKKFKDRILIDSFKRQPAIIRSKNKNDGVIIVGLDRENSFPFNDFLIEGKSDLINKNIIISHSLAQELKVTIGSDVIIMNTGSIQSKKNKIEKFFVTGIFSSGLSEYDESIVFINMNQLLEFVNEINTIDGLNVRIKYSKDIDEITKYLDLNLLYPLNYITWKDKNSSLYKWIKVQKLPILLIFGIIAFVSLVNIISGTSMTIIDKAGQIGLLLSLGMRKKNIKKIFIYHGLMIGTIGTSIGILLAIIFGTLQNKFKFLSISESVYFMNYLPIYIDIKNIFFIFIASVLFSTVSVLWSLRDINKINPAEGIKY